MTYNLMAASVAYLALIVGSGQTLSANQME